MLYLLLRKRMQPTAVQLIWTQQLLHPHLLSLDDSVILLRLSCRHTWLRSLLSLGTSSEIHNVTANRDARQLQKQLPLKSQSY